MIDKIFPSADEAVAGVRDGDVLLGGFGEAEVPKAAHRRAGPGRAPQPDHRLQQLWHWGERGLLLNHHCLTHIVASFPAQGENQHFKGAYESGRLQVSARGDLANCKIAGQSVGSVGGSMDLAAGAREVWLAMRHTDSKDRSKLVERCTYPLTAALCVTRVYTNLALLHVRRDAFWLADLAPGVDDARLDRATNAHILGRVA